MANKEKTKVLVKVYEPLIAIMQYKMDEACLKRDAYLDNALRIEAEYLREEVKTPNSEIAKNYIATQLGDLRLKPLNLMLSTETVDLINEVCKEKNIPRDAFMNRFFLLLIASEVILERIFSELFDAYDEQNESRDGLIERMCWFTQFLYSSYDMGTQTDVELRRLFLSPSNMLDTLEQIVTDYSPFMKVRVLMRTLDEMVLNLEEGEGEANMYAYPFKKDALQKLPDAYSPLKTDNSLGFNTFMSDEQIAQQQALDAQSDDEISKQIAQDKLLAYMAKEKQLKAEKAKQTRTPKPKLTGEAQ